MKRLLLLIAAITAAGSMNAYAADGDISVTLNGEAIALRQSPLIINERTLVPVRDVCEAMELSVDWDPDTQGIVITDGEKYVKLEIDYHTIDVNGNLSYIEAAPALINDITCMPIRAVIEPFGAMVDWDKNTREVIVRVDEKDSSSQTGGSVSTGNSSGSGSTSNSGSSVSGSTSSSGNSSGSNSQSGGSANSGSGNQSGNTAVPDSDNSATEKPQAPSVDTDGFTFYAQEDEEWGFESNGRGYCWVCSYAMLITDLTGTRITPVDIAAYNLEMGSSSGNYMANHLGLADRYGLEFVPALDENSVYFDYFENTHRGATYINAETDEDVKNALIEALSRNPKGIMVRFNGYPHTLIATEYKNGEIYFNDPGAQYMEDVTFENTCLANRFTLSDLTFVQALAAE